jgi:hypothetical protein
LRGLLLVALSGLFAATAALAAPALTAPAGIKPAGTPNADIATLRTQDVEFKWTRGGLSNGQLKEYQVFAGTLVGSDDIDESGVIADGGDDDNEYSTMLTIPANGGKRIFVRLSYTEIVAGFEVIKNVDYVINAAVSPLVDGNLHFVYSPVPGSSLEPRDVDGCKAPPMVEFHWDLSDSLVEADEGAPDQWWFYLGNGTNNRAYFNSGKITAEMRSIVVPNIPSNGSDVIATLWWKRGDAAWASSVYTYTTPTLPSISSPNPGAALSGTSGNLGLSSNGLPVAYWWVYAGPERQSVTYLSDGQVADPDAVGAVDLVPFQNFPDDGSDVYVTLFWRLVGDTAQQWKCREYVYKASSGPAITAPASDTVLPTGSLTEPLDDTTDKETVTWDPKGTVAARWEVVVNHSGDPSDNGVWQSGALGGGVTSTEIPKARITTNGQPIFIVLRYAVNGGLAEELFDGYVVAQYATRKAPYVTAPSATIPKCFVSSLGNEATFEWTDGNLDAVKGYWVYVGKSQGTFEYANTLAVGTDVTSVTVKNLPTDGSAVWVRLWYLIEVTTDSDSDTDPNPDSETGNTTTTTNTYASRDFLFQNQDCPEITSPGFGATINGTDSPIVFTPNSEAIRNLWVTASSAAPSGGDAKNPNPGTADLDSSGLLAADVTGFTVRNLPVDGSTVYITLWWLPVANPGVNVGWNFRTYAFVSSNATPPALTAPNPNEEFDEGGAVTFKWTPNDTVVTGWWLYVGDEGAGSSNKGNSGFLAPNVLEYVVAGPLPHGDNNVRVWYVDQLGNWNFVDYVLDNKANPPSGGGGGPTGPTGPEGETDTDGDDTGSI